VRYAVLVARAPLDRLKSDLQRQQKALARSVKSLPALNPTLARRLARDLEKTERVLAKFDEGTYGICELCGQTIDPERLVKMPMTDRCADCDPTRRGRAAQHKRPANAGKPVVASVPKSTAKNGRTAVKTAPAKRRAAPAKKPSARS
jgi:hypothetical protein